MRTAFEKKVNMLNSSIENLNSDFQKKIREKDKEIEKLEQTNKLLYIRVDSLTQPK
jgi:hypothetical protein